MAAQRIGAQNLRSQLPRAECRPTGLWKRGTHNSVQQMLHHASCSLWIALWDFMTSPGRQCSHHVHLITSLSWNTSGRELLSSATDWNFILWDVVSGEVGLFGSVSPPSSWRPSSTRGTRGRSSSVKWNTPPHLWRWRGRDWYTPLLDWQGTRDFNDWILWSSRETDNHWKWGV